MPKTPPAVGPQYISYRKVPLTLGGDGRVCLYDSKIGLPELVDFSTTALQAGRFVLVHYPTRRWLVIKSKALGLDVLRKIHNGENYNNWIVVPTAKKKVLRPRTRASAPATQEPVKEPVLLPTIEPVSSVAAAAPAETQESAKSENKSTEIPVGVDFNAAMAHVFPDQTITGHFERLLTAEEPVYNAKDGAVMGWRPAFSVQFQALKALTEWRQGRPTEQAKPVTEKPRMSYTELVDWIKTDDAALEYMEGLCSTVRTSKPEPVKTAAPPAIAKQEAPAT